MLFQIFKDENYIKFFIITLSRWSEHDVNFKSLYNFSGY